MQYSARLVAVSCALFWCACSEAGSPDAKPAPLVPVPFATTGDRLGIWDGQEYKPIFVKGVNLGVAVPGTFAGELAATREQYDRWLNQIGAAGVNAIRTYTLHYPRFYDAVVAYNTKHASAPIYILHGAWLDEEIPTLDYFDHTDAFDAGIAEVVDCAHGNKTIAERQGRAFGEYHSDITPWILGWVIGREMYPEEVAMTNETHPEHTSYAGNAISVTNGTPTEAWLAERLDGLVLYERAHYGVERPVSASSWPTLDPLHHSSEIADSTEDSESLDLENLDTSGAPAGYFASYHAYPYYPDFMTRDPAYQTATDSEGLNSYAGYLRALKAHYKTHPLLIAEFGVPTSWGNAHYGAAGMNHGGETDEEQGAMAGRIMRDTLETNCAGGAFFAWIDEWWKRTWIVDDLAYPRDHYPLWHNITSPEQNFGLIAFDVAPPSFKRWPKLTGSGRVRQIDADADAEFFHVRVTLDAPLSDGDTITLGFDTYGDALGESVLPGGRTTQHRNEFSLVYKAPDTAQLYVTQAYDLFGIWHGVSDENQLFHSVASDGGAWNPVRWKNNSHPTMPGGTDDIDPVGTLRVRKPGGVDSSRDGVIPDAKTLHFRLPWTLLQFADPTTRTVIDDDRSTAARETMVSDGIAVSVQLGSDLLETQRMAWDTWDKVPATTEREKGSLKLFADALGNLN
jgi:hypothetical protein